LRVVEIGLSRKAEDSTMRIQELEALVVSFKQEGTNYLVDTMRRETQGNSESNWTITQLWIREMNDWAWELGRLRNPTTSLPQMTEMAQHLLQETKEPVQNRVLRSTYGAVEIPEVRMTTRLGTIDSKELLKKIQEIGEFIVDFRMNGR
jgi:hypothetical protein